MADEQKPEAAQAGTIPSAQAAKLIMVTEQWLRQLVKKGYITPAGRGRYNLVNVVQGYIKFLKDEERRTSKSAADSRVRDARASEIEMKIAEKKRELIPLEDAIGAMDYLVGVVNDGLNSIPASVTRDLELRRSLENTVHQTQERIAKALGSAGNAARTGGELPNSGSAH